MIGEFNSRAFLYSGGQYTAIIFPKSNETYVAGINASSAAAGYYAKGALKMKITASCIQVEPTLN